MRGLSRAGKRGPRARPSTARRSRPTSTSVRPDGSRLTPRRHQSPEGRIGAPGPNCGNEPTKKTRAVARLVKPSQPVRRRAASRRPDPRGGRAALRPSTTSTRAGDSAVKASASPARGDPRRRSRPAQPPTGRRPSCASARALTAGARRWHDKRRSPRRACRQQRGDRREATPGAQHAPAQVSLRPREIAISPVRIISMSPNGRTMRSNASIFSVVPVISMMIERLVDVDDLRRGRSRTICMTSARCAAVGRDLEQRELARDRVVRLEVADLQHVDELVQLLGDLVDRVQRAVDASA